MSGDLVPLPDAAVALETTDVLARAADYATAEKSANTRRAYASDFRQFRTWCAARELAPMPASIETTAAYLAALADAGRKVSTIRRHAAAITYAHRLKGAEPPTSAEPVKAVLRGIRRRIGVAVTRKAPATARAIAGMLKRIPDTLAGLRDRALLLLGFAAALRRSELVGVDVADLERVPGGILLHLGRSKTDQEGEGAEIPVPNGKRLQPVAAIDAWLEASGITEGPLFRPIAKGGRLQAERLSDRAVARIVKRWAALAKLDPEIFAGHSLRAGFVTDALDHGADPFKVMCITRHARMETLKVYDRRAQAFKNHAGKDFL